MAPNADINVDRFIVDEVTRFLGDNKETLVNKLNTVSAHVDSLLQPDGGLHMARASPVLLYSFQEFSISLKSMIDNIQNFADGFNATLKNLLDFDEQLSQPPKDNGSGAGDVTGVAPGGG